MGITAPGVADVRAHLRATLAAAARWQLGPSSGRDAGGLACPVARVPMVWTEFFLLPIAVRAAAEPDTTAAELARGLVAYLARVQRPDGSFDSGFCGDLFQPCNAAFALRPLATALARWSVQRDAEHREQLRQILVLAARNVAEGGMNTVNHRWVAAGGLAHAARALADDTLGRAALDWTRTEIDQRADGSFSEGAPGYALLSADMFLDLEERLGRSDLGEHARRALPYLSALMLPDGGFAALGSTRFDTEGSSDVYARAACVLARLGADRLATRALAKLWSLRTAPGLFSPGAHGPLGRAGKAKLYPSVTTAIAAESLDRWLDLATPHATERDLADGLHRLSESGLVSYRHGAFGAAAGTGTSWLEAQHGRARIEGLRLLAHVWGWNAFFAEALRDEVDGVEIDLTTAPATREIRLPQFFRDAPGERRTGGAVPVPRGRLRLRFGPGERAALEGEIDGAVGVNALVEIAVPSDVLVLDADGRAIDDALALSPRGACVLAGADGSRLQISALGGSGHALQVERYGYGAGDALWSPSHLPARVRFGLALPAHFVLRIEAC